MTQPACTLQRFVLDRHTDLSGCSGTGVVAEGVVFSDGSAVVHWLREPYATNVYRSFADVHQLHGHGGCTLVVVLDAPDPRPRPGVIVLDSPEVGDTEQPERLRQQG